MRTTMDTAGRIVLPEVLRDRVRLVAGEVDVIVDGAALRIEPISASRLVEEDGFLVIPASGVAITDDEVRDLRFADQR